MSNFMERTNWKDLTERWDANMKVVVAKDQKAKTEGTLKGRYLQEHYADGYAFYEIIRVNKKSVRIRVITDIGDDWVLPQWGQEATIPLEYALQSIKRRDGLTALFSKKSK